MSFAAGQKVRPSQLYGCGRIVASWKTTPTITPITSEVDVLSASWTPTVVGCYLVRCTVPFDTSTTGTDAKAQLYMAGSAITYDVRPGPASVFVGMLRCLETFDVTSLSAITVKSTIQRAGGAATLSCRLTEARIEIYAVGDTGIRS